MNIEIRILKNVFKITFPYDKEVHERIKEIPNRKFKVFKNEKFWTVPIQQRSDVEDFAKQFNARFIEGNHVLEDTREVPEVPDLPELTIDIPVFSKKYNSGMYDYQKKGVARGLELKSFLNGDQPGLGKTIQSIATIEGFETIEKDSAFPCLVICPATLKINWKEEIEDWTNHKALILDNKTQHNFQFYFETGISKYFITNYESLKKYFVEKIEKPEAGENFSLKHIHFKPVVNIFKSVIIDESHKLKDNTTLQAKLVKGLTTGKDKVIQLSGTPVINKPKDLMSQLAMMNKLYLFGNKDGFKKRYCSGPKEASNLKELNFFLNKYCFYRRTKEEVLKDLPLKSRQIVKLDISTRHEYNEALQDLSEYLRKYKNATDSQILKSLRGEIMVKIGILKNISARGKIKSAVDWINDTLESGEKLILFVHLKEVVQELHKHFPEAVTIVGDDSQEQRDINKKKFQNDPDCKLIICSIKSAGVGLTLTASSHVTFLELPWTFADCEQCEDRAHRIGQQDNVLCSYLLGQNTIDEHIYNIIIEKKEIAHAVTGTDDNIEENIVSAFIDLFNTDKIKL